MGTLPAVADQPNYPVRSCTGLRANAPSFGFAVRCNRHLTVRWLSRVGD